jgi:CheY-like chemotaxis protein
MKYLLLVDDDKDDQDIFRTALAEVAQSVVFATANNGEEALRQLSDGMAYPDLIFLDINMPILNGFDTLVQIKKQDRLRHIPVFIYSTSVRPEDIEKALRLGAANCIKKPAGFMEVCEFITRLINQHG